ncbi:MAG: DNA polymerase III subunit gamma/tau [Oscillospiraceae bacterium]|nr:DNA polymerase III subunit gamma/tau [Oscillospiraceae bacterium]
MYQALYRKWRPLSFADVLSQPQVTTTLQNQIKNGTTAHAYLFTGSRGTGKTTCARILAKAVNCEHPRPDGNPCLECEICRDAENAVLSDLIEIDAASNNSVEDIRDLRDATVYTPERCKFKVYIIDEVHMLSPSAFNALLKIMEEPPAYVKFILATTEIHKVPATIISRCQRYDFRRIRQEDLVSRLCTIAQHEGISLEKDAAELMARLSDGGMRDAISLLDRCSAYGETITAQITAEAAGAAGREYLLTILDALHEGDTPKMLQTVAQLHDASKDLQRLCEELILMLRDVMLLKATGDISLLHCMADEIPALQKLAAECDLDTVMAQLHALQSCRERMGRAVNRRVELEMTLIRIGSKLPAAVSVAAAPSANAAEVQALQERIAQLESRAAAAAMTPEEAEITKPHVSPAPEPEPEVDFKSLRIEDFKPLAQWPEILEECGRINPAVLGTLAGSNAVVNANIILIVAENPFFLTMFKDKHNAKTLGDAIQNVMGKRYVIRAKCSAAAAKPRPVQEMLEKAKNSGISTTAVT